MDIKEYTQVLVSCIKHPETLLEQQFFIKDWLMKMEQDTPDVLFVQYYLKKILLDTYLEITKEKPAVQLFLPDRFGEIPLSESGSMLDDFIERINRFGRLYGLLRPSDNPAVIRICDYIAEHTDQDINMTVLAEYVHMNKKYLSDLFNAKTGINATKYIRRLKIERAKKLLCDTDFYVYEIAQILAFRDIEYFSRIFKQETGQAPRDYFWYPNDDLKVPGIEKKSAEGEIRIGVIGAYSGTYGAWDAGKRHIYELAAEEINTSGGICGRKVRLLFKDYRSDIRLVEQMVHELIKEKVDVLVGGYLSSAREIIRKIADTEKILYLYDSLYEGGVADHYTFVFSSMPEQNLIPAIDHLFKKGDRKFYILAADYNYGILSCEYAKHHIQELGGDVVTTEYVPDKKQNFSVSIENILEYSPDAIISFLVGEMQSDFFAQWYEKGDHRINMISTAAIPQGHLHMTSAPGRLENFYFSVPYTEEISSRRNLEWTKKIRDNFGYTDIPYIGSDHEAAYLALQYYKAAVEFCGSTDTEKVISVLESGKIKLDAPGGMSKINPEDHHMVRDVYICRINQENKVDIVEKVDRVRSEFVGDMLKKQFNVKNGLASLGEKAPNIQYNTMFYRV